MLQSRAPKCLWDDFLKLETYIRSNTAHEIYKLDGDVPKTVMSGETSDMSQFFELDCFEWVMFQNETAEHPDNELKLSYLVPIINKDLTVTAKIFTDNEQMISKSTYILLTPDEIADKEWSDAQ